MNGSLRSRCSAGDYRPREPNIPAGETRAVPKAAFPRTADSLVRSTTRRPPKVTRKLGCGLSCTNLLENKVLQPESRVTHNELLSLQRGKACDEPVVASSDKRRIAENAHRRSFRTYSRLQQLEGLRHFRFAPGVVFLLS